MMQLELMEVLRYKDKRKKSRKKEKGKKTGGPGDGHCDVPSGMTTRNSLHQDSNQELSKRNGKSEGSCEQ